MEIVREQSGEWTELQLKGRLDSYWSSDLKNVITELIRAGTHHIRINLAGVTYLSSAGLGVLVSSHKQLAGIRGKLEIVNPSAPVKEVLTLTRMDTLLATAAPSAKAVDASVARTAQYYTRGDLTFTVFHLEQKSRFVCRLLGDPELLRSCQFSAATCRKVRLPATALAIGLGALGTDFTDCQGRFGEFLAAGGAAAYLPTDGTNVPDYMLTTGDAVPELQVCYGLLCEGSLTRLVRFASEAETGAVPLTELMFACLDLVKAERLGFVLLAETAGLMGAALRRPPVARGAPVTMTPETIGAAPRSAPLLAERGTDPFGHPQVRDWFTFTAERAYPRSVTLAAGVVARGDGGPLAKFVRPLGAPGLVGHCHAAAFSYRPLPRGEIELQESVASLFEHLTFQGILHLLADQRPLTGLGQSEFLRGACWFSPLDDVVVG